MNFFKPLFISGILAFASHCYSWTISADFNSGQVGTQAERSSDAFSGAGGDSFYTVQESLVGQAVQMNIGAGKTGYGRWGGEFIFPSKLYKGDTVWYQVHVYFPLDFDHYAYAAGNRLKFMRIHTASEDGENHGYLDLYIDQKGSYNPFKYIYEGSPRWVDVGSPENMIKPNQWESYQIQVTLDNVPKSAGGMAEIRIWKNGTLLTHVTDQKTLKAASDYSNRALLFTYWNGGSPKTQSMYADEITITTERPTWRDSRGNALVRPILTNPPSRINSISVK